MDMELDLIPSNRGTLPAITNTDSLQAPVRAVSPVHTLLVDVGVHDASARRQGRGSNGASPIEQQALAEAPERLPRILDNSRQRPVLQHRTRPALHHDHRFDHRRGSSYPPHTAVYYNLNASHTNLDYSLLRQREDSPGRVKQKAQAGFVAAMADIDSREERDDRRDDRRDRGGYRGGNKRRRDGEWHLCLRRGSCMQHELGWIIQDTTPLLYAWSGA